MTDPAEDPLCQRALAQETVPQVRGLFLMEATSNELIRDP